MSFVRPRLYHWTTLTDYNRKRNLRNQYTDLKRSKSNSTITWNFILNHKKNCFLKFSHWNLLLPIFRGSLYKFLVAYGLGYHTHWSYNDKSILNRVAGIFGPNEKLRLCMIEWLGSDFPLIRGSFVFNFSKGTLKN